MIWKPSTKACTVLVTYKTLNWVPAERRIKQTVKSRPLLQNGRWIQEALRMKIWENHINGHLGTVDVTMETHRHKERHAVLQGTGKRK
jgi:hypothetical protein